MAAATLPCATGVSRWFGGLQAVDNVDFTLPRGEVHALIGPNGAGKTTFVSLLSGRITASPGQIEFQGRDITHLPAHRRIGMGMAYTFQITSVFANLTLYEIIALAVQPNLGAESLNHAVNAALARVGLGTRADQVAGDLAYGH